MRPLVRVAETEDKRPQDGGVPDASWVRGRRFLVMGLASTGIAASQFLAKRGAQVTATDIRPVEELGEEARMLASLGVKIEAGGHSEGAFSKSEFVVVSPGVPFRHPFLELARSKGARIMSDIELAYLFMDCPVAAVAGTNGKSTTTELLGEIFRASNMKTFVGGNIGRPAIEYAEMGESADVAVLEISSFHLETTAAFNPRVGILLNVTEDHLDRYSSFDEYAETKFKLFKNQTPSDFAIVNSGDPVIAKRLLTGLPGKGRVVRFSVYETPASGEDGLFLKGRDIVYRAQGVEETYPTGRFKLRGLHNHENIMSAIAAARLMGAGRDTILRTLENFTGLPHRMEFVREKDRVTYIDDSKGTNIGSLAMALRGLVGPVVLIAGGRDKGGDYRTLAQDVTGKVRLMILLGEARLKMKEALGGLVETVLVPSMEEAVNIAHGRARPGDTVLLCPACSSFDMFKSYKERGERFCALVRSL